MTLPEDSAVLGISEGSVQSGAVGGGDGGLQLCPLPALHQMKLLALLQLVALIRVDEGEAVATGPELCQSVNAGPVLVTAGGGYGSEEVARVEVSWLPVQVGVETFQFVRTREIVNIVQSAVLSPGSCSSADQD